MFTYTDIAENKVEEKSNPKQLNIIEEESTNKIIEVYSNNKSFMSNVKESSEKAYFDYNDVNAFKKETENTHIENFNTLPDEHDDYKIVGVIFSTYIIVEKDDMIYLVDQHAAHERILYEKFMNMYNNVQGKQTTIPILINIEPGDDVIINENIELFNKLGYKFESFGNNSIILREVPVVLGQPESRQLFIDIIDKLKRDDFNKDINLKEETIIMMACKKAVKAMDSLSKEEISSLFNDLKVTENPYTCPHGRPVIVSIKKYELEKMFKRIM